MHSSLPCPICSTCPTHLILYFFTVIKFGEQYRSWSSVLCSFLHSHITSSLLGPNISLSTPFSNTLSLFSSLTVTDQLSHPHKTDTSTVMHMLCFINWKTEVLKFFSPTNSLFIKHIKCYNLQLKHLCIRSCMFRSIWTILREPMLILAKVTLL
jgi:hypothetical protein